MIERESLPISECIGEGWYPLETNGNHQCCWSKKEAWLSLPFSGFDYRLFFSSEVVGRCIHPLTITFYNQDGDSEKLLFELVPENQTFYVFLPGEVSVIRLVVSQTWSPSRLYSSKDTRELGVYLLKIEEVSPYSELYLHYPSNVEIETTSECNINPPCPMCERMIRSRASERPIPEAFLQKLIHPLAHASCVALHGIGEPLLSPRLYDILDMINPSARKQFNTNGLLLTEENAKKLIKKNVSWISVSFDAATVETYKRIRGEGFELIKQNVKRFSELKNRLKAQHPVICVNMTLMKENIGEVVEFIEMAREIGADEVFLGVLAIGDYSKMPISKRDGFTFNYYEQILDEQDITFRQLIQRASQRANELDLRIISSYPAILEALK